MDIRVSLGEKYTKGKGSESVESEDDCIISTRVLFVEIATDTMQVSVVFTRILWFQ